MKINFRKLCLSVLMIMALSSSVMAMTEAECSGVGNCDLTGMEGLAFYSTTEDLKLERPIGTILDFDDITEFTTGQVYAFSLNYNSTTGILTYNLNGVELTGLGELERSYQKVIILLSDAVGGEVEYTNLVLNGNPLTTNSILSNEVEKGIVLSDLENSDNLLLVGNVRINHASSVFPKTTIYFGNSVAVEHAQIVLTANEMSEVVEDYAEANPTETLSALSLKISRSVETFFDVLGVRIWRQIDSDFVEGFELYLIPVGYTFDFGNEVDLGVFEVSEDVLIGTQQGIYTTNLVNDGVENAYKTTAINEQSLLLANEGSYDIISVF